ncbi:uncharacterized protein METZ01_LOCUS98692, partial [marine metagenome]
MLQLQRQRAGDENRTHVTSLGSSGN